MRSIVALFVLVPALALADEPPLVSLELRLSGGLAAPTGARSSWARAPLAVAVGGEGAVIAEPWTSLYGLVFVEDADSAELGVAAGVRFRPRPAGLRFSIGGVTVLTPKPLAGASAALGVCFVRGVRFCPELEAVAFVGPDDGSVATQLKLALELGFDVL